MSMTFSLAPNAPIIGSSHVRVSKSISTRLGVIRAQVTLAPKPTRDATYPQLSKQEIPLADLHVQEVVERQTQPDNFISTTPHKKSQFRPGFLAEAYECSRKICKEYAKTFYLGYLNYSIFFPAQLRPSPFLTRNSTHDRRKTESHMGDLWGTDELVDGPNAVYMSSAVLDRWEKRLHDIFNGRPYDMLDAALTDTVAMFPLDIKPFRDMIEGMRMDTRKTRYKNFEELYLYCYYVAGTVGLMSVPVMGIAAESLLPAQTIYNAALYLGIGNKLTNILRDVGEDASRGRVYLPQDELAQFGLSDKDVFSRTVTEEWKVFMKHQISRARLYFSLAEEGASQLKKASRWPVWSSLIIYGKILDAIEDNGYDNLTRKAYVGRAKKLMLLPLAFTRSLSFSPKDQHTLSPFNNHLQ